MKHVFELTLLAALVVVAGCPDPDPPPSDGSTADAGTDGSTSDATTDGTTGPDVTLPTPRFVIGATSGTLTEGGGIATFTVVLSTPPASDVTITLEASPSDEALVTPSSLTFTPSSYATPQTVTVTGLDDSDVDGDVLVTVVLGAAVSDDPAYAGLDPADVTSTNIDDDGGPGIRVSVVDARMCDFVGSSASFTVQLATAPTAPVIVPLYDAGPVALSPWTLVFDASNWADPQTVTVTATGDVDADTPYSVVFGAATSEDPAYAGIDADDLALSLCDLGDDALVVTDAEGDALTRPIDLPDLGATAALRVHLAAVPTHAVTVTIALPVTDALSASVGELTFTPENALVPQIVELERHTSAGASRASFTLTLTPSSEDTGYDELAPRDVVVRTLEQRVNVAPDAELDLTRCNLLCPDAFPSEQDLEQLVDGDVVTNVLSSSVSLCGAPSPTCADVAPVVELALTKPYFAPQVTVTCYAGAVQINPSLTLQAQRPYLVAEVDGTSRGVTYQSGVPVTIEGDVTAVRLVSRSAMGSTLYYGMVCSEIVVMAHPLD